MICNLRFKYMFIILSVKIAEILCNQRSSNSFPFISDISMMMPRKRKVRTVLMVDTVLSKQLTDIARNQVKRRFDFHTFF